MKHSLKTIFATLCAVVAIACSSDPDELKESYSNPIKLKGDINTLTQVTKANDSGFENNDKVGVFIAADNNMKSSGNYLDNVSFSYNSQNNALTPTDGKIVCWPESESRFGVFAYYPFNSDIVSTSEYPFSVATDQSSVSKFFASDFLWASVRNVESQAGDINLAFNHKLSKINITLVAGNGFKTDELTSVKKEFTIIGVATEGTIDLATGTATANEFVNNVTPLYDNKLGFSAIVYPQTANVIFKVVINGETYAYSTSVKFAAGYQYNYTLAVNNHGELTETMNGVTEWKDGENQSGQLSNIITGLSPQFKAYLLEEYLYTYDTELDQYVTDGTKIDANGDGNISIDEAEMVKFINFIGDENNIEEIRGFEFFANLNYIRIRNIANTSIDISKYPELVGFVCYNSKLTSLDVTNNPLLESLTCAHSQLTSLNISKNRKLKSLFCHSSLLTTLDVSNNEELTYLSCSSNKLTILNLNTNLVNLYCYNNDLKTLDVSKNKMLESLGCNDNRLTTIDVSNNPKISYLRCTPMNDITGRNILTKIYMGKGQSIKYLYKPDETGVEYK